MNNKKKHVNENKILFLDPIKKYLNKIKDSYQNIYHNFLKLCIFPIQIFNEINETIEKI